MSTDYTVYHEGRAIVVNALVFEEMCLIPNQAITTEQLVRFIELESAALLSGYAALRACGIPVPDCARVEATLARWLAKMK